MRVAIAVCQQSLPYRCIQTEQVMSYCTQLFVFLELESMHPGIILFLATRIPPMVMGLGGLDFGYGLVVVSFFAFWLALTGRIDKIAGTI